MTPDIGLDKENILQLSTKIREAWNSFFWESKVCQKQIRFTREEQSNYVGDLLNYFDDTLHHLEKFNSQPDYLSSLYETIAVLQMMYIQQDLVDELLNIFKLDKSASEDKKFVRSLRNELIGHPISRFNRELISSVFITGFTKGALLSYIRYHRDNNYKYDLISHNWMHIFAKHENYLKQFLGIILIRICEILDHFSSQILLLKSKAGQVGFVKLVHWVNCVFEVYTANYPLFEPSNILLCYQKREIHARYRNALGLFQDGLGERIVEVLQAIYQLTQHTKLSNFNAQIDFAINFYSEFPKNISLVSNRKISYEFSKLYEKDHIFGVTYFRHEFEDDKEVIDELDNMFSSRGERTVEFYCSYEYLRYLFERRGLL